MKVLSNNIRLSTGAKLPEMPARTLSSILKTQLHTKVVTHHKVRKSIKHAPTAPVNDEAVMAELAALIS